MTLAQSTTISFRALSFLLVLLILHHPCPYGALASPDGSRPPRSTITVAPAVPSRVPQFVDDALFTSAVLNSTNVFRDQHGAQPVGYNATLARFAAGYLARDSDCRFAHSGGPYGENIALGCADVRACVDLWGDERREYDFRKPGFSEATGHFTQLVWKNTSDVGCGRRLCGQRGWFLVCEYWPRGNIIGQFGEQVGKQVKGSGSKSDAQRARNGPNWRWSVYMILGFLSILLVP
ncbi:hypothetical protein VTK73DRAFT_9934 [Phialemonium thermophilum]|uniref:SCP domain-containing protein n=1 Tax=Phialemonium thermophilum TaxID=223376 RepID=A0ABR3VZD5_9PEZI